MTARLALLLIALGQPVHGATHLTPESFATGLPLRTDAAQPFHRLELPLAVHTQARPDLADLRIFNRAGEPVAMALSGSRHGAGATATVAVPHFPLHHAGAPARTSLDVRIEQDGRLVALHSDRAGIPPPAAWVVDLSAIAAPVQALELAWRTPAAGFSAEVRLETSDDLQHWQVLAPAAQLLDLRFGGRQLQQRRITFAAGRYRYLRLEGPALPELAAVHAETVAGPAPAPTRWLEVSGRPGDEPGTVVFDLGAHLAATRLTLRLPEPNTVVPVTWQVKARQRDPWRTVAQDTAWRLRRDGADLASPPLELPGQPGRYWQARLDARAGMGRAAPVLRLGWTPVQVVFIARGEPPFLLAFGNRDAPAAYLPLPSLIPGYRPGMEAALPLAASGAPRALGGRAAPAPGQEDQPPPDWRRWLLWGVLLAGVGLLACLAAALRRPRPDQG